MCIAQKPFATDRAAHFHFSGMISINSCVHFSSKNADFFSELNNTRVPAGFEIEFTCGPGLALFGNKTVECLVDGFWSGQAPKCFTMIDNNYKAKDWFTYFLLNIYVRSHNIVIF